MNFYQFASLLFLTVSATSTLAMDENDEVNQSGRKLIEYVSKAAKSYHAGHNLAKLKEEAPFPLYLKFADTLKGASPEASLPIWGELSEVFLNLAEKAVRRDQQKQEFFKLRVEWEQRTVKGKTDKIWFDLFMLRLTFAMTPPLWRQTKKGAVTGFDEYYIALMNHEFKENPAWWSHEGMVDACQTIGTETTRRLYSPLAQSQHYGVWILPYPFDLSSRDLVLSLPDPKKSNLWLSGFNLARTSGDGDGSLFPYLFYAHDLQHLAIYYWFLSGGELAFFKEKDKDLPTLAEYWQVVCRGREVWFDSLDKVKSLLLDTNPKIRSNKKHMTDFFAFMEYHETRSSLNSRLKSLEYIKNYTSFKTQRDKELLFDENFYKPLLCPSLLKVMDNQKVFFEKFERYRDTFYNQMSDITNTLNKTYQEKYQWDSFSQGYTKDLLNKHSATFLNITHWLYDMDDISTCHDSHIKLMNLYGTHHDLYKLLAEKKKEDPTSLMALYQYQTPLFNLGETVPPCHFVLLDLGSESPKDGTPYILHIEAYDRHKKNLASCLPLYEGAIEKGYYKSAHNLGVLYNLYDYKKSKKLIKKAIELGSRDSVHSLVQIYKTSDKLKHKEKAFQLLEEAALQGDVKALKSLANSYRYGLGGVEVNYEKAAHYFMQAIEEEKMVNYSLVQYLEKFISNKK